MLKDFNIIGDNRGSLISIESKIDVPFEIKRVYYIFGNKNNVRRGFHAHKNLQQVLIAVAGSCKILLDNGKNKQEVLLDLPSKGLLIKDCMWREMFDFSSDCVLLVLANEHYDENDYIRDYNQFLDLWKKQ